MYHAGHSDYPERVTVIGGGPAGLAAAIYAARAGLRPVVVAPPFGGQLMGKGVDVENYPGLLDMTGGWSWWCRGGRASPTTQFSSQR